VDEGQRTFAAVKIGNEAILSFGAIAVIQSEVKEFSKTSDNNAEGASQNKTTHSLFPEGQGKLSPQTIPSQRAAQNFLFF